jgi:hypothetical protein
MVQDLLKNLLGGGSQQQELRDFVQRYQQGHPAEGYSDQEVLNRYQQVAPQLPADAYQQSAEQAFARLSPQERQEFAEWMQQRTQQQQIPAPQFQQPPEQFAQNPGALAEATAQLQKQQPGFLDQLMGGLGGLGGLASAFGGGQSKAGGQPSAGGPQGQSGIPQMNTAQKAALAGIAAMAIKMAMDSRRAA